MSETKLKISICIPLFNEQEVIPELLQRLARVREKLTDTELEYVLVDDGSSDQTLPMLIDASKLDARLFVIGLSRNFGQQAAYSAALEHAEGDAVILMDGDLQDPPEVIPMLVEKFREGFDVVYVKREKRKESFVLKFFYKLFYRLLNKLSYIEIPTDTGDFSLISRRVVNAIIRSPERHRFLRGLRAWAGFKQTAISVERAKRFDGHTKYSPLKLLQLAGNGIFSFSILPLRIASFVGALTVLAAGAFGLYSIFVKLFFVSSPKGFTGLITVIVFMSGVQLIFLGMIGEYLGRIYEQVKGRPLYLIDILSAQGRVIRMESDVQRPDSRSCVELNASPQEVA